MNLFDDRDRDALLARIHDLSPESTRRWGTLSLPAALDHMRRQIDLALGKIESEARPGLLRHFGLKYLAIYVLPWPKGVTTAPVLLGDDADDVETERRRLLRSIAEAADRGAGGEWSEHPLFGPLPGRTWGVLMAKHLDHHLRQFSA